MKKVFATMMLATILTGSLWAATMPQTTPAKSGMAPAAALTATAKTPAKKKRHHRSAKK